MSGRRLRLLFLLPFAPGMDGRHGGARATGQTIAGLAARHDVAIAYLVQPGEAPAGSELARLVCRTEAVVPARPPRRVAPKLALLRGVPTWASEVADAGFAARVRALAREWAPDIVQVEYPVMGQYLEAIEDCPAPRVLVDHEASIRDLREWHGPLARLTAALDERAWRLFERRTMDGVQAVVVFTVRDRRALEALGSPTPVVEVPLGTPLPAVALDPVGSAPPGVLFVGSFGHPANTDAALWLGREIFPRVRAECEDARLTIVGPDPPSELRALEGDGVRVTGEVPDVTPHLDAAAVVAAPVRLGGGMRVKVLEGLAAGKATVATPLAVEGLDVLAGEQIQIAATAEDFGFALSALLADEDARRALASRAREWALENLGWDASIERYEALYARLLGRPQG